MTLGLFPPSAPNKASSFGFLSICPNNLLFFLGNLSELGLGQTMAFVFWDDVTDL